MNSILAVERGLPPGLWLPTAEESTEQYLAENFNHGQHDYEDIVDYGSFVVALAVLGAEQRGRESFMPIQSDFVTLFREAGYGISPRRLRVDYGGEARLQRALGFYPDGFKPEQDELLQRLEWMAEYPLNAREEFGRSRTQSVASILEWGAKMDLLPSTEMTREVLGERTSDINRIFGIEGSNSRKQLTYMDMFRFGAKVIRENDGPVTQRQLSVQYAGEFLTDPYTAVKAFFGNLSKFWLEFDCIADASGLRRQDIVNVAVRHSIRHGETRFSKSKIESLAKANQFPSTSPIYKHFGELTVFQGEVADAFDRYQQMRDEFTSNGVTPEAFRAACLRFEASDEFAQKLKTNIEVLTKLKTGDPATSYILKLIEEGLDLTDETTFKYQQMDFLNAMRRLGINTRQQQAFIWSLLPRFNPSDAGVK